MFRLVSEDQRKQCLTLNLQCQAFFMPERWMKMKKREKPLQYVRVQNPFDDGAAERLRRMGLRSSDGRANDDAILTLSCVYAGLLFDDLCDYYQDYACVSRDLQQLFVAAETAPARQRFLMLCLQYDGLSQPLPNPIWWISGDSELASVFADSYIRHLKQLCDPGEVTSP